MSRPGRPQSPRGWKSPAWAVGLALACVLAGAACEEPAELRVLFIGNSYTYSNDLPAMVVALGAAARPPLRIVTAQHTPGGSTLEQHAGSSQVAETIRQGDWDAVVLQEQSLRPILDPDRMVAAAEALAGSIRQVGARPVLFLTWPRRARPSTGDAIEATYRRTAVAIDAEVAPVGEAWRRASASADGIDLYAPDGSHPSAAGSFLSACVLYSTLTGQVPTSLAGNLPNGVSAEDAAALVELVQSPVAE